MAGDFTGHAVQGAVDEAVGEAPARGLLHQPLHTRAVDMGRTRVLKSGNYDLTPIFPIRAATSYAAVLFNTDPILF